VLYQLSYQPLTLTKFVWFVVNLVKNLPICYSTKVSADSLKLGEDEQKCIFTILRSELQNLANSIVNNHSDSDSEEQHRRLLNDLSGHIRDLEEKRARGIPIISLVDNMVKLGSLYRGPQDAPLSHRVRNIPIERTQRPMVASYDIQQQQEQQHLSKQRRADIQVLYHRDSF
jgi:hypothetical protein